MWALIFGVVFVLAVGGFIYLCSRVYGFSFWERVTEKKWLRILIAIALVIVPTLVLWLVLGYMNAAVAVIFLIVFWLIADLVFFVVGKIRRQKFKRKWAAVPALAAAIVYLSVGWALAHNVWVTSYDVETDKTDGEIRVVMFADSHVGTTFDGVGFERQVEKMNGLFPDIVLIAGDFVDDDTDKADMIAACTALGKLETKYGVYFSFGNHDKGYYDSRGYDGDELKAELEKNGVHVLEDEALLVDGRFYIVGRQDRSEEGRAEIAALTQALDKDKFMLVIDHQPNDYEAEAAAGVDLVLSGHTHGGQLFPVTYVGEWLGMNDRTYGYERRGETDFIVTSGISDWALKFKTGTKSEIVVVNIRGGKNSA